MRFGLFSQVRTTALARYDWLAGVAGASHGGSFAWDKYPGHYPELRSQFGACTPDAA